MNISKMRNWATPITIGTFLISGTTGIFLLLRVNMGVSREIHELIGILMILGVIFHTVSNWKAFKNYFTKPVGITIISIFIVLGLISFTASGEAEGHGGQHRIIQTMQNISLNTAAQVVKAEPDTIKDRLEKSGIAVNNTNQTIKEIASSNRKNPMHVLMLVFDNVQQNKEDDFD